MFLRAIYVVVICLTLLVFYQKWEMYDATWSMHDPVWGVEISTGVEDAYGDVREIVEFMDYRCGYCRQVHSVLMELAAELPDVKIVVRHYPIFGEPSVRETRMALAAARQGKFTEMHNLLVSRDVPVREDEIDGIAGDIGLDLAAFRIDMNSEEVSMHIVETMDAVETLSINSTPSFLIDDLVYRGTPDLQGFKDMLDEAYGPDISDEENEEGEE